MAPRLGRDATLLIAAQALRAAGYGFTAVILGALLASRHYSHLRAGVLLTAVIGGTALSSLLLGVIADRIGRRICYSAFYVLLVIAGAVVAADAPFVVLMVVALTGALSTDVIDNGPATTLEQVMLATDDAGSARVYGRYNSVGSVAGALGALATALPGVHTHGASQAVHAWLFVVFIPVGIGGVLISTRLSRSVEASADVPTPDRALRARARLGPSRSVVRRLAGLFAIDAAGGGLATTGFLSYLFVQRYDASVAELGWLFFSVSIIQAISVEVAPRLANRFGLVTTMVGTHLPSNVLLAGIAFAPTFPIAAVLLLSRTTLSQMDVPTRQALVMTTVTPAERTPAAALTNAARYSVRPVGPVAGGALQQIAIGAPLLVAGVVKAGYDIALWIWARRLGIGMQSDKTFRAKPAVSD